MIRKTFFYYFSPTGGTKRIGETFAKAAAENVVYENLGDRSWKEEGEGDGEDVLAVVALPVYGGRIPELAAEKLRMVTGGEERRLLWRFMEPELMRTRCWR